VSGDCRRLTLARLQIFEVIAAFNSRGTADRPVIEVGPCIDETPIVQRDLRELARVEARTWFGRSVAFEFVEEVEHGGDVCHFVQLAVNSSVVVICTDRSWIDPKIEERSGDAAVAFERQL